MGWLWQNPAPADPTPSGASPAAPSQSPASATPPPARSDAADDEMQKFLDMIQSEMSGSKPADQPTPQTTNTTTAASSSWFSPRTTTTPSPLPAEPSQPPGPPQAAGKTAASRAISESLLATEMSCRDAFDYAWHCHTPGAQWNAVYRYGAVRSCSDLWDDFWFCMRTKSYSAESRAAAVRAHFRAREAERYGPGRPSSEDVWESRDGKVEPGTAFNERFDGPEEDDREWQVREIERRRAVRDRMGFNKDS